MLDKQEKFRNQKPDEIYRSLGINYIKYFKMDALSKVAFLASELLLGAAAPTQKSETISVVLSTAYGCLDVDQKFEESRHSIASPALFVYTLPNIMLGEICIRHKFKGEQLLFVSEVPDYDMMAFYVNDLLHNRGMTACLCGHIDAYADVERADLFWISSEPKGALFTAENLAG